MVSLRFILLVFKFIDIKFYLDNMAELVADNPEARLPDDLLDYIRKRSNRNEQSRFPYKIWTVLSWVGDDQAKAEKAGCGWMNTNEFFINKRILCETLDVKINTLNVNLKTLGFQQTRNKSGELSYWKNSFFTRSSCDNNLERIRNSRCRPESLSVLNSRAVYLPLLDQIQLFMMDEKNIHVFKRDVIDHWETLVGSKLVFAITMSLFCKSFISSFDESVGYKPEFFPLQQYLTPRTPNVINIFDFAVFLARFGPYANIPVKIMEYQAILPDIRQDFFMFNSPTISSYFAMTYHNCFKFPLSPNGEYHCYNLPLVSSSSQYIVDEDGTVYKSWNSMVHSNYIFTQRN